ncbi:hypothetical protein BT93_L4923 [Corymbia citriodora subsp. variegata]|uniref:Metallo-dependent hydrolase n=1 Tax=Corymbia citriodora subsp. variegata TaxID=360336 RepID=A0A8T0CGE1_CORYI|nr:hypothetical protein BT93_L4923 [Corymbia citriodora subsp. variegata]
MANVQNIPSMKARVLTVMATRAQDQELVAHAADEMDSQDQKIVPCFGWHPWFSHQMFVDGQYKNASSLSQDQKVEHYQSVLTPKSGDRDLLLALPDPQPFSHFLDQTKKYLQKYPLALVGEVGLDKSFRIPEAWLPNQAEQRDDSLTPGGREGRRLSPYRVSLDHQRKVLLAQLSLAGELGRAVSVHGVQAHGVVFETLSETWKGHERQVLSARERKRQSKNKLQTKSADEDEHNEDIGQSSPQSTPYPPRICLHSYSGSPESIKQYTNPAIPADIFFSFSTVINFSTPAAEKTETVIKVVPDDRILVESDLHIAGDRMDGYLEEIIRKICEIKEWSLEDGVSQLGKNWKRFVFGRS